MDVASDPDWLQVSTYEYDDDGEREEVPKECEDDDCEGVVYSDYSEKVCGTCSLVHDNGGFEPSLGPSSTVLKDHYENDRPTYDGSDKAIMYGGFEDAYNGDGDYEFGSYDEDGLTVHHLRNWNRGEKAV